MRVATDAIVQGWELEPPARESLYRKIARRIQYHQRRNALARLSHTRTRIRNLHRRGIKLTKLPRCDENTS